MALKYRPRMVGESHRRGGRVVEGAPLLREAAGTALPEANPYIAGFSDRREIGGNRHLADFLRVRDPFVMRSQSHNPFLPNYKPKPINLGEGISWTPSIRTAQSLWMKKVRPPFDRSFIQGYPGGPIYYRPQIGGAA